MDKFKKDLINFLDRRKHSKQSNIRLACIFLFIVMIVGLFFPLMGLGASLNIKNTSTNETVFQIFNPKENVFEVDLEDFITGKNLTDYKILGTPIGKISIGKFNVYKFITAPMPELKWLKKTNDTLNSGVIDFLVSKEFTDICDQYLGDFGKGVKELGKTIYDISNSTSDVLDKVIDLSTKLNNASRSVQNTLDSIENIIDIIDVVFIVILLIPVVAIVLLVINKGPRKLPAILFTIFTVIMLLIGLVILVGNSFVTKEVLNAQTNINDALHTLIYSIVPDAKPILKTFGLVDNIVFDIKVSLTCGLGWWLVTIPSVILTVLAYIVASLENKVKPKTKTKKQTT